MLKPVVSCTAAAIVARQVVDGGSGWVGVNVATRLGTS